MSGDSEILNDQASRAWNHGFTSRMISNATVEPTLDVPVGLLAMRLQVDAIRQAGVEQLDRLGAGLLREVNLHLEHSKVPFARRGRRADAGLV
jgi:hypothetical protein